MLGTERYPPMPYSPIKSIFGYLPTKVTWEPGLRITFHVSSFSGLTGGFGVVCVLLFVWSGCCSLFGFLLVNPIKRILTQLWFCLDSERLSQSSWWTQQSAKKIVIAGSECDARFSTKFRSEMVYAVQYLCLQDPFQWQTRRRSPCDQSSARRLLEMFETAIPECQLSSKFTSQIN